MTLSGDTGITFPDSSTVPATATRSLVRLNTALGNGSTNTAIRRFTNIVTNQGTDISYTDSATLGASFTINTNGVYAISFTDSYSAAQNGGISKNSTQLTTSVVSITASDLLSAGGSAAANAWSSTAVVVYLVATDIIRAHTAVTPGVGTQAATFTIIRVA